MNKHYRRASQIFIAIGVGVMPLVSLAATIDTTSFRALVFSIITFMSKTIMPLLIALAVFLFVFGVIRLIVSGIDSKKRAESIKYMIWGLVSLTVLFSLWGIVAILRNTFGVAPGIPQFEEGSTATTNVSVDQTIPPLNN